MELQNGCACCSLSAELLTSIETLLQISEKNKDPFDHIIIELSGVADPSAVQGSFDVAIQESHPLTESCVLDSSKVVTLVDACTFGTDWMSWNSAGDRKGWVAEGDDCTAELKVTELLAEQVRFAKARCFYYNHHHKCIAVELTPIHHLSILPPLMLLLPAAARR